MTQKPHKVSRRFHHALNISMTAATLMIFAIAGVRILSYSSAAGTNPYGGIDWCYLESGATAIYGWTSDPNATSLSQNSASIVVGGVAQIQPTTRAGFRDAPINKYIDTSHAGDPKPGTYGFRAVFSGLYKGTKYTISGTALNVGAGANTVLPMNQSSTIDGVSHNSFAGGVLPDACLAVRPTPAPTPPPPTPTPTPTPSPTPTPTPKPTVITPAAVVAPAPSADADAVTTTGTMAAELHITAGNATKIHLVYGEIAAFLDRTTTDIATAGVQTTHTINGLKPSTKYYFQIVRSNDAGKVVNSPTTSFTTKGFNLAFAFTNSTAKGIAGIKGQLVEPKLASATNASGVMTFVNVPVGTYTLRYTYSGKSYTKSVPVKVSAASESDALSIQPVTLRTAIDLNKLAPVSAKQTAPAGSRYTAAYAIGGLIALAAVLVYFVRRRRSSAGYAYETYSETGLDNAYGDGYLQQAEPQIVSPGAGVPTAPPAVVPIQPPSQPVSVPPPAPELSKKEIKKLSGLPTGPETSAEASHIGESLKTMVMRSMAEEARRRHDEAAKNPNDPENRA